MNFFKSTNEISTKSTELWSGCSAPFFKETKEAFDPFKNLKKVWKP